MKGLAASGRRPRLRWVRWRQLNDSTGCYRAAEALLGHRQSRRWACFVVMCVRRRCWVNSKLAPARERDPLVVDRRQAGLPVE